MLVRGVGMAGAHVFVPEPPAFGAGAQAKGQQSETLSRGEALAHGIGTLAHRSPRDEGQLFNNAGRTSATARMRARRWALCPPPDRAGRRLAPPPRRCGPRPRECAAAPDKGCLA